MPLGVSRDFLDRVESFFKHAEESSPPSSPDVVAGVIDLSRPSWEMDRMLARMAGWCFSRDNPMNAQRNVICINYHGLNLIGFVMDDSGLLTPLSAPRQNRREGESRLSPKLNTRTNHHKQTKRSSSNSGVWGNSRGNGHWPSGGQMQLQPPRHVSSASDTGNAFIGLEQS